MVAGCRGNNTRRRTNKDRQQLLEASSDDGDVMHGVLWYPMVSFQSHEHSTPQGFKITPFQRT